MKLENLERALELKRKRDRIFNSLELSKTKETIIINFDKQRPLNVLNQIEVINDYRIEELLLQQLHLIEEEMIELGIKFDLIKVK